MVKPPKIRHSKARKEPVTINLDSADVKREAGRMAAEDAAPRSSGGTLTASETDTSVKPNAADEALAADAATQAPSEAPAEASAGEAEAGGVAHGDEPRSRHAAAEPTVGTTRRAGMAVLAAGVAGAVIALAGAAALQWAGALPAPSGESAAVDGASLDALRSEVASLKQQISRQEAAAPDPALGQALAESSGRIDDLAAAMEQLQGELAAVGSANGAAGDAAALQALESRVDALETAAGTARENAAALDDLNRQLAALRSAVEIAGAEAGRLDALEQRIAEMGERVQAQAAEPGMALAVAATALKSAIDRGAPFMMELETYAAIAPDVPQIAELREMAASGVPTRAEIETETADAAARMIAASAAPADAEAGFLERLFASARSLIEVRPVGTVEGDSPGAIVARMEVALKQGDYRKAVEEFQKLPPQAQAAGQEFIDKVQARLAADRLLAQALAGALKTPGGEG